MKIREHGIQSRERARIYKLRPKCDSNSKNFSSIRINDCYSAFLVFAYGIFASFVLFCGENLMQFKCKEKSTPDGNIQRELVYI